MTPLFLVLLAFPALLPVHAPAAGDSPTGALEMTSTTTRGTPAILRDPPGSVRLPSGKAVVRECYNRYAEEDGAFYGAASSRSSKTLSASRSPSRKGSGAKATAAAPPPTPSVAMPSSAPAGSFAMAETEAVADMSAGASYEPPAEPAMAQAPMKAKAEAGELKKDGDADDERTVSREKPADGRVMDWGGTTYLSNDDSMSLASAQRLLWAVKNNAPFSASQVRPHELLNYFSFDTAPLGRNQVFSVLGAAEQTGSDALSLSLAVKGATPARVPMDLTLVVDRSGSMSDEGRMEYVKRGLSVMSGQLQKGDRVDIVLFDDEVCVPLEDYVVGRDDPSLLTRAIDDMQPRNSTDLNLGLREGYRIATARVGEAKADQRNQRLLVLTDALLNTGEIDTNVVSEIGKAYEQHGIRLTGVGVGQEFNDEMLDRLTEKGKGAYVYLGSEAVVDRVFGAGFNSLTRTVAHDVRFSLTLPPSLAMERFYGEESSTNAEDVQPINYYAGTTQVFLQDLKVKKGGPQRDEVVTLTAHYRDAASGAEQKDVFTTTVGSLLDADRHNLDKARALMAWSDVLIAQAMGGDPCGEPLTAYLDLASRLTDDAEVAYVNGLIGTRCNVEVPVRPRTVSYKVKVNSDIPIAEVAIVCGSTRTEKSLSAGETVVSFNVPAGTCGLVLEGSVPMTTKVKIPETGGEVRCLIRGGKVDCS